MSLFAPMDVRGPDQRRKRLMQKLAQQGRRSIPMPPSTLHAARGVTMGEGRGFSGSALSRPQSTHGNNVLSSILSRLGVGGQPGAGEFSGGHGSPISHGPVPGADPYSRAPSSITGGTPIGPSDPIALPPQAAPAAIGPTLGSGGYGGPITPPGYPTPDQQAIGAAQAPHDLGNSSGFGYMPPDTPQGGLVPLGNGMFYDPATDKVVGSPAGGGRVSRI